MTYSCNKAHEDGKIAYIDQGSGPIILLVHGVPTSSYLYRKVIPKLIKSGYRVIAPDLLGYGASDKPNGYEIYSNKNQSKRLLSLMSHLSVELWTQVCNDAGGLWTWEMLSLDQDKVNHLILLNTIIYDDGFCPPMTFTKGIKSKWYTNLYNSALAGFMVKNTMNNGTKIVDLAKKELDAYKTPMREGGNKALYWFFSNSTDHVKDYRALHEKLDMPVSVIWGTKDEILQWKSQADEVMKNLRIPEKDVYLFEKADHFIQEDVPQELAGHVINMIKMSAGG